MYSSLRVAMLGMALLTTATTASAISLASFTPRIDIQNAQCQAVYTSTIEGCIADDFKKDARQEPRCSSACVQGMAKIAEAVIRGCKDVDVGETSIIGVFQNGLGIQALCPGISVTTISSTTALSTKAPAQTSAQPPASKVSTTLATSASRTDAAQLVSTSSHGIATDPSVTSIAIGSPTNVLQPSASSIRSSVAGESTQAPRPQLSNADSGGGSPFDVVAAGSSLQLRVVNIQMAAFLATAVLFVGRA